MMFYYNKQSLERILVSSLAGAPRFPVSYSVELIPTHINSRPNRERDEAFSKGCIQVNNCFATFSETCTSAAKEKNDLQRPLLNWKGAR
jgi:hypothetical protein